MCRQTGEAARRERPRAEGGFPGSVYFVASAGEKGFGMEL